MINDPLRMVPVPPGPRVELTLWILGSAVQDNGVATGYGPAKFQDVLKSHADGAHPILTNQLVVE